METPSPPEDVGPCNWLIEPETPTGEPHECGEPGVVKVTVRGKVTQARINLCDHHRRVHNEKWSRVRHTSRNP